MVHIESKHCRGPKCGNHAYVKNSLLYENCTDEPEKCSPDYALKNTGHMEILAETASLQVHTQIVVGTNTEA